MTTIITARPLPCFRWSPGWAKHVPNHKSASTNRHCSVDARCPPLDRQGHLQSRRVQRLALSFLVIVGLGQVTLEEGHAPKIMIASRLSLPVYCHLGGHRRMERPNYPTPDYSWPGPGWPPTYPQRFHNGRPWSEPDRPASSHPRWGRRTSGSCSKPHASHIGPSPVPPWTFRLFCASPMFRRSSHRG